MCVCVYKHVCLHQAVSPCFPPHACCHTCSRAEGGQLCLGRQPGQGAVRSPSAHDVIICLHLQLAFFQECYTGCFHEV